MNGGYQSFTLATPGDGARVAETVLLSVSLFAGLVAALIVMVEISAARAAREKAEGRAANPPRANALDLGMGLLNRFASIRFRQVESELHGEEVAKHNATIKRQWWAFGALLLAAVCGFIAGMLGTWS